MARACGTAGGGGRIDPVPIDYCQRLAQIAFDADYHFVINPQNPSRFYPLVGLDLAFNSDAIKVGLNLGGGVNFMFTENLAGFAEVKYIVSDWDGRGGMAGIYF